MMQASTACPHFSTLSFGREISDQTVSSAANESKSISKGVFNQSNSFERFKLIPEVQIAIQNSGMLVPTSAQLEGIPRLLNGENLLLISQTGKGKTLSYLIPIVDKLIRTNGDRMFPQANRPRGIVIVPTRELAVQTLSVIRKVFGSSVSSLGLAPDLLSFVKEKRVLASAGADLLVATPSRLQLHLKSSAGLSLSQAQFFVFDEADTLCDSVYEAEVRAIVTKLVGSQKEHKCQIAIVGATKTAAVSAFIQSVPGLNISTVQTSDAHTLVPHLDQVFVPVGRRKRTSCLVEVLGEQSSPGSKTLIFTNSVKTCNFVSKFLRETQTVNATSLHGEMPPKLRSANFAKFTNNTCDVLVCTNLASRGIDLDNVNHVIMYDFPHTLADYIHRAGRTARAGRLGKVTALFTKSNLPLARKIQEAIKNGKPVEYKQATVRRAVKIDKYRAALEELKAQRKGRNVRGLRAAMGLPPHAGIGSVEKRAVARDFKSIEKARTELEFLRKRKRLGRKDRLPQLPNRRIDRSETNTVSQLQRNEKSGTVQLVSLKRSTANEPRKMNAKVPPT